MKGVLQLAASILLVTNCGILFLDAKKGNQNSILRYIPFLAIRNSSSGSSTVSTDTIAPAVLNAIPAVSSVNIPVNQKIMITFTESIVPDSNPITITDSSGNTIVGTSLWDKDLLQYSLTSNLAYNTKYTITLSAGIKDTAGNPMASSFSYNFTTEVSADNVSPTVVGTTPVSGTVSFNVDSSLSVVFSEPILISTFNLTNVTVTTGGTPVTIAVNANGLNGNIVPVGGWAYGTNYVVTLKKEIQDQANNPMIADYLFTFTTQADTNSPRVVSQIPEVYAVTPPLGLTVPGHSINDPIQVTFDKELLVASVTSSSFTVKQGAITIPGTLSVYPSTATATDPVKNYKIKFTPSARLPLTNGVTTPLTVTLTSAIQDISGNTLAATYSFTFETKYTAISTSVFYSCVLLPAGKVRCWGTNITGQLGTGDYNPVTTMSAAVDLRLGEPALKVSTGTFNACVLLLSGGVKCWGNGFTGAIGNGGLTSIPDPFYIPTLYIDEKIKDIQVKFYHVCAVTESGKFRCWGGNPSGQLGYGYISAGEFDVDPRLSIFSASSLTLSGETVTQMAVGTNHSCALTTSGKIKCWGDDTVGQVGVVVTTTTTFPDSVGSAYLSFNIGGALPTQISSLNNHTCATLNTGDAICWGLGLFGAIGTIPAGLTVHDSFLIPKITGLAISKMGAGAAYSCSLFTNGTMTCWGDNTFIELGFPGLPNPEISFSNALSTHPISFLPGNKIVDLGIGYTHGCLILDTDQIRCWGTGANYVLGDGSNTTVASATGVGVPALPFYTFTRTDY